MESFKRFVERAKAGDVTRQEILDRLVTAVLLVAAITVVLSRLLAKATSEAVVTHGPTVKKAVGDLLSRLGESMREGST